MIIILYYLFHMVQIKRINQRIFSFLIGREFGVGGVGDSYNLIRPSNSRLKPGADCPHIPCMQIWPRGLRIANPRSQLNPQLNYYTLFLYISFGISYLSKVIRRHLNCEKGGVINSGLLQTPGASWLFRSILQTARSRGSDALFSDRLQQLSRSP